MEPDIRYIIVAIGGLLIAAIVTYHVVRVLGSRRRARDDDEAPAASSATQADDAGSRPAAKTAAPGSRDTAGSTAAPPPEPLATAFDTAKGAGDSEETPDESPSRRSEPRIAAAEQAGASRGAMSEADEMVSEARSLQVRPYGKQRSGPDPRNESQRGAAADASPSAPVEEFIAIWVVADEGQRFGGESLISAFSENSLEYGDRNVFHRRSGGSTRFMVVNGVEPGTFDLSDAGELSTPAIVLLLPLPGAPDPPAAFQEMLDTARALERALGGSLKDENRNAMSLQTIEHSRNRVNEFSRKQMSVRS